MLMDVRQSKLANGVRVITSSMPHVQSVALGIWVGVGSRHESPMLGGISHFTEHLLFKGTRTRSAKDISTAIEGRGGYLNAFTGEENTCYYARVGFDQLDNALDVLSDMYMRSRFGADDVEKERGVIVEEIMMYRDQPRHQVQELLMNGLWPGHALGRPIIGTPETLKRMTSATFRRFVAERYVARNTVVALAGRVDHDACVKAVTKAMRGLPVTARPKPYSRVPARMNLVRTAFTEKDIEQTHLALGLRLFGYRDDRRHALKLLSAVLGENMSSRLFQIVREKHGLAYSVHSHLQLFEESGALTISAGLDRKRKSRALELIVREMARMRERAVGAAELRRAKDYVIGQMRLGLESTSHQMMWVGDNLLTRGRFIPPEESIKRLSSVTSAEIRELAGVVMRPARASLAIVSPDLSETERARMMAALATL